MLGWRKCSCVCSIARRPMRPRELARRELGIVFGARVTWFVLAASALLIGHGFVLAIDLYSAASRSASNFALMQRELDPLAGVIRPTLGGLQLSAALLGSACMVVPVLLLLAWFRVLGGHVDLIETTVALAGHGLHLLAITAVALAAAAATRTVAQATVATLVISLGAWAIDVGDGF